MFLFSIFLSILLSAAPPDFVKDSRGVTWRGHKIKPADLSTFETMCPAEYLDRKGDALFCAVDAKNIYLGRTAAKDKIQVQVLTRAQVKELGKNHFQMGQMVFYRDFGHAMDNADFATFNELEEETESGIDSRRQWASDHKSVFCQGQVVTGLSPKSLAFWPFLSWDCKDLVSNQLGNALPSTGYIKDNGGVFLYVDCKLQQKVQEADPASFTVPNVLFPSRARDGKGHLYNCGKLTRRRKASVDLPAEAPAVESKAE